MIEKKVPLRKCSGCLEKKDKREMIRVVKTKGENDEIKISVDLSGKANGRGAYVCKNEECLKKARKAHRLERSFKCQISEEIYDRLEKELNS